jgi:hypothetical protein
MANIIDILIKAKDQTKGAFKSATEGMKGLDDAAQEAKSGAEGFGDSWAGIMTGISSSIAVAQQVAAAMREIYNVAREGAELEFLEQRFDNLTTSIGTTSEALLGDLREATQGMYSDAELMGSATDFMALGLAKSHDEVVRLSTVAGALNMNMNQLVLTLTNQTTMRFDALGVSVDGFKDKVKELEDAGYNANDAFTEAFLQQAEEQIERVGSATDTALGSFMQFESQFENTANSVKTSAAQIMAPAVAELATALKEGTDFANAMNMALDAGVISQQEYNTYQKAVRTGAMETTEAIEEVSDKVASYGVVTDTTAEGLIELSIQQSLYGEAARGSAEALGYVESATLTAELAMRAYNEQLLFSIASEGMSEEAALALASAMGLVDANTMFAYSQVELLKQKLETGQITVEQYEQAVADLADEMDRITDKEADVTVNTKLNDTAGIKDWKITDMSATYRINTIKTETRVSEAAGGIIRRAPGGLTAAAGGYWVGEAGPEPFFPAENGRILSNTEARQAMREGGGRGANIVNVTINTPVNLADRAFVQREITPYIMAALRKERISDYL